MSSIIKVACEHTWSNKDTLWINLVNSRFQSFCLGVILRSKMSIHNTSTSYRTVNVSSDPATTVLSSGQYIDGYRTMSVSSAPVQYGIGNGYDTVRYLMPVQQAIPQQQMQYVLVNQPPQVMQQMVSPVYLQNIQRVRVNSLEESDIYREQIVEVSLLQYTV